jgi:hypothetical protein
MDCTPKIGSLHHRRSNSVLTTGGCFVDEKPGKRTDQVIQSTSTTYRNGNGVFLFQILLKKFDSSEAELDIGCLWHEFEEELSKGLRSIFAKQHLSITVGLFRFFPGSYHHV